MPRQSELPKDWKEQLLEGAEEEQRNTLEGRIAQLSVIPLEVKTSFTMYLPARHVEAMKAIAEVSRVSVQDLFREGVDYVLDKNLKKPTRKRRTTKKGN